MIFALAGLTAGFLHVLAGPDHLAAIAPLAAESRKSTWGIGLRWGLGHTGGVGLIGVLALLFREVLPIESISGFGERIVGIVLIGIGTWGLLKLFAPGRRHLSGEDEHIHSEPHLSIPSRTAFAVGLLHGLAGSSHIIGILPALALPTRTDSVYYLVAFGIGTVAAMTLFSAIVGFFADSFFGFSRRIYKNILAGLCSFTILIGIFWIVI